MSSMRVLIDARMLIPPLHGIARYTQNLIQGLVQRGHKVTAIYENPVTKTICQGHGVEKFIPCKIPFSNPIELFELEFKIPFNTFDVVHFTSFAVPIRCTKNTVVTIHDLIHLHSGSLLHKIYYNTFVKVALQSAGRVISVSGWTKNELVNLLKLPGEKIDVIRNGLEEKWFQNSQPSGVSSNKPYFLCVANPKPHKNVFTLIEACRNLWGKGHQFNLVLALGGKDAPSEWKIGPQENIQFLTNLSDQDLIQWYRGAVCLVSPSIFEGFNYPAAEAMAVGTAALLSKGSAHNEFEGAFYYGEPRDVPSLCNSLTQFLESTDHKFSVKNNLKTVDQMVDETIEVYKKVKNK